MDLLAGRALAVALSFLLAASCLDAAAATVDGITAIYNFGDSISDTGNLIRESPAGLLQYIAKLPYGMDMHGPTGRCSDGYLMIDFLGKLSLALQQFIILFSHDDARVIINDRYKRP